MEYEGCDSAGIAIDDPNAPNGVAVVRAVGDVEALRAVCKHCFLESDLAGIVECQAALGHTRWATHGAPSEENAHPQSSGDDDGFLVVHNGLIPNYLSLRTLLQSHGYCFTSETDSECIAKLCAHLHQQSEGQATFPELVAEVVSRLDGPFGLVVKSRHFPMEIVAAVRGSKLAVATLATPFGAKEIFIASDAACLVPHSCSLLHLEEEDLVHVKAGCVTVYNLQDSTPATSPGGQGGRWTPSKMCRTPPSAARPFSPLVQRWSPCCSPSARPGLPWPTPGSVQVQAIFAPPHRTLLQPISRRAETLDLELDAIKKGSFPHFLLKEIFEQPESLQNTMRGRLNVRRGSVLLGGLAPHRDMFRHARRLVFIAAGSAYYGALAVRSVLEEMAEIPVHLEMASDFADRRPPMFRDDIGCFVSHTGENPDVLSALQYCRTKGAFCVGFTNQVGSSLGRATDCGVYLHAGHENGVTSTKAFSSEVVVLLMFAVMLSEDRCDLQDRRQEIVAALQALPGAVHATLRALEGPMKAVAKDFQAAHNFLFMARGNQLATCMEGALKLNETATVHCEAIHLGELKHGPLALVDADMPVLLVCTREPAAPGGEADGLYPRVKSSLQQVLARHGRPIVIVNGEDDDIAEAVHCLVRVPPVLGCLQTVVNIIPCQLLAYHLGVLRGADVDGLRHSDN
eukprot:EG_transcript_5028